MRTRQNEEVPYSAHSIEPWLAEVLKYRGIWLLVQLAKAGFLYGFLNDVLIACDVSLCSYECWSGVCERLRESSESPDRNRQHLKGPEEDVNNAVNPSKAQRASLTPREADRP